MFLPRTSLRSSLALPSLSLSSVPLHLCTGWRFPIPSAGTVLLGTGINDHLGSLFLILFLLPVTRTSPSLSSADVPRSDHAPLLDSPCRLREAGALLTSPFPYLRVYRAVTDARACELPQEYLAPRSPHVRLCYLALQLHSSWLTHTRLSSYVNARSGGSGRRHNGPKPKSH